MGTRSRTSRMTKRVVEKDSLNPEQNGEIITGSFEDTDDYQPILPFLSQTLRFCIPSETRYMHGVLAYVMKHLPAFAFADPHHSNVYVALNEAISNAIRHGHKNDP